MSAQAKQTSREETGTTSNFIIAGGYLSDVRQQKRLTHGPAGSEDEELIADDRKAIAASLKEAIGENAKWLNDRDLRGISTHPGAFTAPRRTINQKEKL